MTALSTGTGPGRATGGAAAPRSSRSSRSPRKDGGDATEGLREPRPGLPQALRPCLSALLGLILLAAPLHTARGAEASAAKGGTPAQGLHPANGAESRPGRDAGLLSGLHAVDGSGPGASAPNAARGAEAVPLDAGGAQPGGGEALPAKRCQALALGGELTLGAGGSVSSSPYKGYGPDWLPFPMITYEGERFFIRGYAAGVKIINLPYLELSAFAGYDDTGFKASESSDRRLRRLENRSSSAQAGMELRLISPYGMFHASVAGDVLSRSNGFSGDIGFIQSLEFGPLELLPAVGAHWSDARYNTYYYGVTRKEARKSGLGAYAPGSGFAPYVSLAVDYSLTDQWELFCQGEVTFLSGAAKDSPMTGETHMQSLTLGLTYTF